MRSWRREYGVQDADADDLIQEVMAVVARRNAMSQIRPATETRHRLSGRRRPLGMIFDARWRHDALRAVAPPLLFGLRLWASVCLALYVAFWLELDNAYWAGTSAAIVCQPHLGASLRGGTAWSAPRWAPWRSSC